MAERVQEPSGHRDAVFGLARRDGAVLLVSNPRVSAGQRRIYWDLPGGGVHAGEDLEEALRREWREETGTEAAPGDLFLVMDGRKERPGGRLLYTWRAFFFEVDCAGTPCPGEGIEAVAWVPEGDLAERLSAPYHAALRARLAGAGETYGRVTWQEARAEVADVDLPRALLVLAALAAVGATDLLRREVRAALAAGESSERIAETLLQIVPYAGYPRAITAFAALRSELPPRATAADEPRDRAARGREVFGAVYGDKADAILAGLRALDPVLARWTIEHAYGRVLAREGALSLLERELLAVAVLTALGGLADPLLGHMRAAARLGAGPDTVAGAVQVVPSLVGERRKAEARALLARL